MKLPITDQFLLDLCKFLDETEDIFRFIFHPPRSWKQLYMSAEDPIYRKYHKILKSDKFKKLIYRLKKNNYIKSKNLEGKKAIILTKRGVDKAFKANFKTEAKGKIKRKDGKWIMLIFDIPKRDNKKRWLLRSILQNLGYKVFQKSVWVTPYDVSDKTEKLLQFYNLDQHVKILLVEKM